MTQTMPRPVPRERPADPVAVAVGNASLLGVGYFLLGRRGLAYATGLVTMVLIAVQVAMVRSERMDIVLVTWWLVLIGHGYLLARRRPLPEWAPKRRLVAFGMAVPVLLAAVLLRVDAGRTVTEAQGSADCARATAALDRVWWADRVVNAPAMARGDRTVEACRRLRTADAALTTGLSGYTGELQAGFDSLAAVLADLPGHEAMVGAVLDGFLARLPARDPCDTVTVTNWLRDRPRGPAVLDRAAGVVARTAPAALAGCGDRLMAAEKWSDARARYWQLIAEYPKDPLVAGARDGARRATLPIELDHVRGLLSGSGGGYCDKPAKYSGAAPYRKGTNRAVFLGNEEYTNKLPASWKTSDAARAVLVVCVGEKKYGTAARTCPYENGRTIRGFPDQVTFHRIGIPVRVYKLRTGKLVVNRTLQISGGSCPRILRYTTYITDLGPPSQVYVTASTTTIRAAFRPLVVRL